MKRNPLTAVIIAGASIIGFAGIANVAFAASGNGVTSITPCDANGVCSAGAAGSYTVTVGAANVVTIASTSINDGWKCNVQVPTGTQTRMECRNGASKVIAQATIQHNQLVGKTVTR
jgi:hypothetical protein